MYLQEVITGDTLYNVESHWEGDNLNVLEDIHLFSRTMRSPLRLTFGKALDDPLGHLGLRVEISGQRCQASSNRYKWSSIHLADKFRN